MTATVTDENTSSVEQFLLKCAAANTLPDFIFFKTDLEDCWSFVVSSDLETFMPIEACGIIPDSGIICKAKQSGNFFLITGITGGGLLIGIALAVAIYKKFNKVICYNHCYILFISLW